MLKIINSQYNNNDSKYVRGENVYNAGHRKYVKSVGFLLFLGVCIQKKDNNASKYLVFQRTTIYIILEHHFIGGKKVNAVRLGQKQHTKRG